MLDRALFVTDSQRSSNKELISSLDEFLNYVERHSKSNGTLLSRVCGCLTPIGLTWNPRWTLTRRTTPII